MQPFCNPFMNQNMNMNPNMNMNLNMNMNPNMNMNMNPNMNMNMQNNFNIMNNMNNFNCIGCPNMNQMMPEQVIAGNWQQMYTSQQPNFNPGNNNKLTVIFKTGKGMITTIFIDYGKTVNYLLNVYFKRMGKPELINRPKEIGFIFNAKLINFNEQRLVEDFFSGVSYITITVNDIGDLIGA